MLPALIFAVTANTDNVPTCVIFVCTPVDNEPVNVNAVTLLAAVISNAVIFPDTAKLLRVPTLVIFG